MSTGLLRCSVNINFKSLNILHYPVFYFKHDVSETGFCPRFKPELFQVDLMSSSETETSSFYWTNLSRFHLIRGRIQSTKCRALKKIQIMDNVRNCDSILIYHRHTSTYRINLLG
jgi:hypothetical protein